MPRKRTGYDAACYYDGKLLGRCTKADSDAYTLLMNACGGDAARVLREYAYFSPELRAILENAALMQADRSRTGGMFHAPKSSPWGEVQSCETLCPGVFLVSTASHGGTMVANEVAAVLSPAAKKCGFKDKGYICYEEDAQESVVLRELLDKKLWNIPDRIKDKGQFEEKLNQSILFVRFPIVELAAALSRSSVTVKRSLKELEDAGLILRVRRGVGEPNRIYTLLPKKEGCHNE